MRVAIYGLALAVGFSGQLHARDCNRSSSEVLAVTEWSAQVADTLMGRGVRLSMTIENRTDEDLRMVDAKVFFDDVLGRGIANIAVNDDARIQARGTFQQSGTYETFGSSDITRIAAAASEDIVVTVCTTALVTGSGAVTRFD